MALVHLNFDSVYLNGSTDVNIILPDKSRFSSESPKDFYNTKEKFKVLYLLHGTFGCYSDWVRKSNVEQYACEKNLVVVMPSALNSDYVNWDGFGMGYSMFDFMTEELMPLVENWFPVSNKREDTFIAGLSMGGLGACGYALNYPEKFAAAYIMSHCPYEIDKEDPNGMWYPRTINQLNNAGGLQEFLNSKHNLWQLAKDKAGKGILPKLYFTCGTSDRLIYDKFKRFRKYAEEIGLEAEFDEVDGYDHEWRFWDMSIEKAINLLVPTEDVKGNAF